MKRARRQTATYAATVAICLIVGMAAGWTSLGAQFDNYAYDWMFRLHQPALPPPESAVLAIDEATLNQTGGMQYIRPALAEALDHVAAAAPKAVAVDLILADRTRSEDDARLEAALAKVPNLALACDLLPGEQGWELPRPEFARHAAALGQVHAEMDALDGVTRHIPLEKASPRERHWALALEAYRLSRGIRQILETPGGLQAGSLFVPAGRPDARAVRIRFLPPGPGGASAIPHVTVRELNARPELARDLRGKVVFVGMTAQTATRDRWMTPISNQIPMPGVEIHAHAFETLAHGHFLTDASNSAVLAFCVLLAAIAAASFRWLSGWHAYPPALALLGAAHVFPYWQFTRDVVFPYTAPVSVAWLSVVGAAGYQFVVTRRLLRRTEMEKARYQQAMHFVTHEMRTPLTAIQGSSQLMSRYNLGEEKRREIAELIHSESRRLARMIETFLNVERLSAGQIELKRETIPVREIVGTCVERVRLLAERKQIRLRVQELSEHTLSGDRELLEYAIYNLLTNAIKYSPAETEVTVSQRRDGEWLRLSVQDQGIGMDQQELGNLFTKFYRTRKAEASGEKGTGLGLSIVSQIVEHHGGRIEVASAPGKGSCFTLVLPAPVAAVTEPRP